MRLGQEVKFESDLRRCVTPTVALLGSLSRTASVCVGGSFWWILDRSRWSYQRISVC